MRRDGEVPERAVVCDDGASYATALRAALGAYLEPAPIECLSALGRLEAFAGAGFHHDSNDSSIVRRDSTLRSIRAFPATSL